MSFDLLVILAAVICCFVVSLFIIRRWLIPQSAPDPTLTNWLTNSATQINQRLDFTAGLLNSLQKDLGAISQMGQGIKSLQDFLQSPKLRGNLGEQVLQDMIGESFPKNSFHLQYSFKSGARVDAVLKTDAGLLCIDSKFPLDNYKALLQGNVGARSAFISDVKKHITDISQKYILPEDGTTDFALMYIPSESVYSEVVNITELNQFARNHRVYPVSPNTLCAHLQVLLLSFQGQEIEHKSREVFKLLRAIQKDYSKVEENLGVLGRHLTNAYNQMGHVSSSFNTLGQKLSKPQSLSGVEIEDIKHLET